MSDHSPYKHTQVTRRVLRSLVPVICPPEAVPYAGAIVEHVGWTIDSSPRALHYGFGVGALAYDVQAVPMYGKRASNLVGAEAEHYYESWEQGITPMHTQLAKGFNQLLSLACYEQPEMMERVGYLVAPWIEEVTKKRLRVYGDAAQKHAEALLAADPLRPGVDVRALKSRMKEAI